ncbi:MAG: hypothetical protein AAFX76_07850 [Planctomycetota bacterium]
MPKAAAAKTNRSSTEEPSDSSAESSTGPTDRRPSRGWYGLAFVLMLVGVAAFTASLTVARAQVDETVGRMQRLVAPGQATLTIDRPGTYLVYYERIGEYRGEAFDTTAVFREAPALDLDVRDDATGEFLHVGQAKYEKSQTQMFNNGRANSEFVFTVATPGDYTVTAAHKNEGLDDRVLLAVGPPVVGSLMSDWRGPFGGAAVLAFTVVAGASIVLVTWMLRHGHVTRREDHAG